MDFTLPYRNQPRLLLAFYRGLRRGENDREVNFYNDAPLSGEWAGESIPELLGDLAYLDGSDEEALCDAYQSGYDYAHLNCRYDDEEHLCWA